MTIRTSNSRTNPDNSNYHGIELISIPSSPSIPEVMVLDDSRICDEIIRLVREAASPDTMEKDVSKAIRNKKQEI